MHLADTELFIMIYGIVFVKQVTISVRRVRASNGCQMGVKTDFYTTATGTGKAAKT